MSEIGIYNFSFKEVAEALIKQQGLHEGIWTIAVQFGIGAANMGPTEEQLQPTAIVPVIKIGLAKGDKEGNLSVDAAKVNPATAPPSTLGLESPALPSKE